MLTIMFFMNELIKLNWFLVFMVCRILLHFLKQLYFSFSIERGVYWTFLLFEYFRKKSLHTKLKSAFTIHGKFIKIFKEQLYNPLNRLM